MLHEETAMPASRFRPEGVIPAILLPFREDLSIDVPAFKRHLRDAAGGAAVRKVA